MFFLFASLVKAMDPCSRGQLHPCFPELSSTGCGIASVLSKLCFLDGDVNSGKGYDVSDEERFPASMWVNKAFNLPGNEDEFALAKKCTKIFYLQNNAAPAAGANAYFSAALTAAYSRMIITDKSGSKMAVYDTARMQWKYNRNPDDLTKHAPQTCFNKAYGAHWFFCRID